jgi:hypothetical protein
MPIAVTVTVTVARWISSVWTLERSGGWCDQTGWSLLPRLCGRHTAICRDRVSAKGGNGRGGVRCGTIVVGSSVHSSSLAWAVCLCLWSCVYLEPLCRLP